MKQFLKDAMEFVLDVWEAIAFFVGAAVAIVVVIGGMLLFINAAERHQCKTSAEGMGRDYKYSLLTTCRVQTDDGTYVPLDNYRLTEEEQGG